jgi:two-component sensor histidine kinase
MQELNHRTSNNLQLAASFLYLDARRTGSPEIASALTAAAVRLQSVSLVHEQLSTSNKVESVDINVYLRDLLASIENSYADTGSQFSFVAQTGDQLSYLHCAAAMQIGMIVTELLTNSLKYAGPKPTCSVTVIREMDTLEFRISDNGPGIGLNDKPGLGSQIVQTQLAQLHAFMRVDTTKPGAHFIITLPSSIVSSDDRRPTCG